MRKHILNKTDFSPRLDLGIQVFTLSERNAGSCMIMMLGNLAMILSWCFVPWVVVRTVLCVRVIFELAGKSSPDSLLWLKPMKWDSYN